MDGTVPRGQDLPEGYGWYIITYNWGARKGNMHCLFESNVCASGCVCRKLFGKYGERGHTLLLFLSVQPLCCHLQIYCWKLNSVDRYFHCTWEGKERKPCIDTLPLLQTLLAQSKQSTLQPFNLRRCSA